jgi:ubiquinone/menaquinone biosynthesis C-methylase UbiE
MEYDGQRGVSPGVIQGDFDRIAALPEARWDHNSHYHRYLLAQLPPRVGDALDLGCGTGEFARALAGRADRVVGLDLSPRMIEVARGRSRRHGAIDFQVADALEWQWPEGQFDCIASIATLHHLPMEEILPRMRRALTEHGILLVLDLYRPQGIADALRSAVAMPLSMATRAVHTGRLRSPAAVRAAWTAHARHDVYPTVVHVRRCCVEHLPGAQMRQHLFWRYSIVWRKGR